MSQNDLQRELDRLFTFEWDYSPIYREKHEFFNAVRNQAYTNIEIRSEEYGLTGVANHYHEDNGGAVIIQYAMCKQIREAGDLLSAPMDMLQDCEYHYYGLLLNCLAVIAERPIKKLVLRDCYNGKDYSVRYNPRIAQTFLTSVAQSERPAESGHVKQLQTNLFA